MGITPQEFKLIASFLHEHSGILIAEGKEYLLENRLTVLMAQNGCNTFLELHEKLQKDSGPLCTKVIDALTTNETLWFRDDSFFNALNDFIVPHLLEKAKRQSKVRIWSAACSTGQEPYSVAMLLNHVGGAGVNFSPEKFEILATDISPSAIVMATRGRYSQLAITRGMRKDFLNHYFTKKNMAYEINPAIRQMVTFKRFNLKGPFDSLGKFDFVLCRNVLIYFSEQLKCEIYDKIHRALNRDGFLAIGASESPRGLTTAFRQKRVGKAVLYKPVG
ncbi:MAG: protein-glutamate O-methyltransferase CheR [Magnetococcales bacterium]|nr:protein-glutamate O-methyltransferase CheR [Magnetococcales bacterium]